MNNEIITEKKIEEIINTTITEMNWSPKLKEEKEKRSLSKIRICHI